MHVNDNDLDLTEAEQIEKDADAKGDTKDDATDDKGADDAAGDDAAADTSKDDSTAALTAAAASIAKAADALTATAARRDEAAPEKKVEPPKEPDWAAERAALKADYDANKIDDDEYENRRESLLERKAEWTADRRVDAKLAERDTKDREDRQARDTQSWEGAVKRFTDDASNADIVGNPAKTGALNGLLKVVATEKPGLSYDEMFAEAKARVVSAFGGSASETEAQKTARIAKETKAREKAAGRPPTDLNNKPRAGEGAERGENKFADLDELEINDLENTLARLKDDKVEEYLSTAPGGLKDNPRGK